MIIDTLSLAHPEGGAFSALHFTDENSSSQKRPLLVFSHATGFHAATYRPLLQLLAQDMDIVAADSRGHGQSTLPADVHRLKSWKRYYSDLCTLIDLLDRPVVLAGHSIGGMCSLAVAARKPKQVRGVIAMDPVMLDPSQGIPMKMLQLIGRSNRFPLAAGAKRRRAEFESADEAFRTYRDKKSFASWPDEWLRCYTDAAFKPAGHAVRLRCEPEWESRTFAMVEPWPWRFIPRIQPPVQLLLAQKGSTCSDKSRIRLRARRPDWDIRELEGSTHFLPMEKTALVAETIRKFVAKCDIT